MTAEPMNREALARIIEAHAWEVLDQCGGDLNHPYLDQKVVIKGRIESSLVRADQWLSRPAAERAEGEAVAWRGRIEPLAAWDVTQDPGYAAFWRRHNCEVQALGLIAPPPIPSSTSGEEDVERIAKALRLEDLRQFGPDHPWDIDASWRSDAAMPLSGPGFVAKWTGLARAALSALSRPQPVAETVEAREFIDNWFAPWGSWKTAWWEMAVSDDVEMTDANALKALRKILAALRPSAHGEAG